MNVFTWCGWLDVSWEGSTSTRWASCRALCLQSLLCWWRRKLAGVYLLGTLPWWWVSSYAWPPSRYCTFWWHLVGKERCTYKPLCNTGPAEQIWLTGFCMDRVFTYLSCVWTFSIGVLNLKAMVVSQSLIDHVRYNIASPPLPLMLRLSSKALGIGYPATSWRSSITEGSWCCVFAVCAYLLCKDDVA